MTDVIQHRVSLCVWAGGGGA